MSSHKPTTQASNRIAASQRARNDFDNYELEGGDKYPTQEAWDDDEPSPDYSLWEMGEPVDGSLPKSRWSDAESGDNDAYEIFY